MITQRPYGPGSLVRVKKCHGAYPLPDGLRSGAFVRVIEKRIGYVVVDLPRPTIRGRNGVHRQRMDFKGIPARYNPGGEVDSYNEIGALRVVTK